jgi:myo-inositol-1(or 4)-monophosphatase
MQEAMTDWTAIRDWTLSLVDEAAGRARAMVAAGITADTKANGTVVTDVDRAIELFLREAISMRYPEHAILGEEFGLTGTVSTDIPLWCLDPVDGTTNLANGLPLWCISVGVVYDGRSVAGVVNAPMMRDVYAGATGTGATRNGEPLPLLPYGGALDREDVYIACSTSVRKIDFSRLKAKLRVLGSAALDLCYVASSQSFGCQSMGTSLYDLAAGMCLVKAVGADAVWLQTGEPYDAMRQLAEGPRTDKTLVVARPGTLLHVLEGLSIRPLEP